MKIILATFLCLYCNQIIARKKDINFQNNLTWQQVKQKAKDENKYIFIDCYTTWCGPCKVMSRDIFTQSYVANFFNDNFISIALQFDRTKSDGPDIQKWYDDINYFKGTYAVTAYPTYLFFDAKGKLVHYVIGSSPTGEDFVNKSKYSLNHTTKIGGIKTKFKEGERTPSFLKKLIDVADHTNDPQFQYEVINAYLKTQGNLLTKENLRFISVATQKRTDPGFPVLLNYSKRLDIITGKGTSHELLKTIGFDEIALPELKDGGIKIIQGGGMIGYNGKLNKNVNWLSIKSKLDSSFPQLADEILCYSKIMYFRWLNDWPTFSSLVSEYASKYSKTENAFEINAYARDIFLADTDIKCVKEALKWSDHILTGANKNENSFLLTKVNLLYKAGEKEAAIALAKVVDKNPGYKFEDVPALIDRMAKGEKTW
jgi:thioredoxin-related protein